MDRLRPSPAPGSHRPLQQPSGRAGEPQLLLGADTQAQRLGPSTLHPSVIHPHTPGSDSDTGQRWAAWAPSCVQRPGLLTPITPSSDPAHLQGHPRCRALGPLPGRSGAQPSCQACRRRGKPIPWWGDRWPESSQGPLHPQTIVPGIRDSGLCTGQPFPLNSRRVTLRRMPGGRPPASSSRSCLPRPPRPRRAGAGPVLLGGAAPEGPGVTLRPPFPLTAGDRGRWVGW